MLVTQIELFGVVLGIFNVFLQQNCCLFSIIYAYDHLLIKALSVAPEMFYVLINGQHFCWGRSF